MVAEALAPKFGISAVDDEEVTGDHFVDVVDFYLRDDEADLGLSEFLLIDANLVPEMKTGVVEVPGVVANVHVAEVVAVFRKDHAAVQFKILRHLVSLKPRAQCSIFTANQR